MKYASLTIALALLTMLAVASTEFSGRVVIVPTWEHNKTVGASTIKETFGSFLLWTHTSGTNANQMSTVIVQDSSLTNAQTVTLSMTNLVNSFGDTVAFDTVRLLYVKADNANANSIEFRAGASDGWASWAGESTTNAAVTLPGGGAFFYLAPGLAGALVATNAHNISMVNMGTNTVSYELYIGGSE